MSEEELILVTGASGFIASHIVQQLQKAGKKVRGTVRSLKNDEKVKPLRELCPDALYQIELVESDLNDGESWKNAVKDCTFVFHVASPFVVATPRDENELIKPALDGTLNVLKACKEAKTVKKVVLTSSVAAISELEKDSEYVFSEDDWSDLQKPGIMPYCKSKTLAEKAAWDFVKELQDDEKFDLVVMNPVFVMGPVLCGPLTTSMILPKRLLERSMPMVPRLNFSTVDVRDVAAAHIAAISCDEAVNHRHILSTGSMWIQEIAQTIQDEFKSQGYKIPTKNAPYAMMWLYGIFDNEVKALLPNIGKKVKFENTRFKNILGIQPHDLKDTILDMCYSMIDSGKVKKTDLYRGRQDS